MAALIEKVQLDVEAVKITKSSENPLDREIFLHNNNSEVKMHEETRIRCEPELSTNTEKDNVKGKLKCDDSLPLCENKLDALMVEEVPEVTGVANSESNTYATMSIDNSITIEDRKAINDNEDSVQKHNIRNPVSDRLLSIIDSDSEDENNVTTNITTKKLEMSSKKSGVNRNVRRIMDSDTEEDSNTLNSIVQNEDMSKEAKPMNKVSNRFQTIIDSESEEEQMTSSFKEDKIDKGSSKKLRKKGSTKGKNSTKTSKVDELKEIHSESQRLLREVDISLPYHRPKQRKLEDFLNRKKLSTLLPNAPTMAAKLKMSSTIVNKVMEEKEKEVELFYKSSDSEDEILQTTSGKKDKDKNVNDNKQNSLFTENITIEDTQKITRNVQDFHNKKETVQQGCLDLGVPRKLFGKNFHEDQEEIVESTLTGLSHSKVDSDEKRVCPSQKSKQGFKSTSVPRKLFGKDFEKYDLNSEMHESQTCIDALEDKEDKDKEEKLIIEENSVDDLELMASQSQIKNGVSGSSIECKDKLLSEEDNALNIFETPHIHNKEVVNSVNENREKMQNEIEKGSTSNNGSTMNCAKNYAPACQSEESSNQEDYNKTQVVSTSKVGMDTTNISLTTAQSSQLNTDKSNEQKDSATSTFTALNQAKPLNVKKNILSNIPNIQPKLRGTPGMVINLSDDVKPNKKGINNLINRFLSKHSKINKHAEDIPVITLTDENEPVDKPLVTIDVLPHKLSGTKNEQCDLNKPGAKLLNLQNDLKQKMALKRDEEWRKKEQEMKDEEGKSEDEIEFISDREAPSLETSENEESEPEEDDVPIKDKKRSKCTYIESEAEVSTDGEESEADCEAEDIITENDDEDNCEEDSGESEKSDLESEGGDSTRESANISKRSKKPKRIIKAFEDDLSSSNMKDSENTSHDTEKSSYSQTKSDIDMFETGNGTDPWMGSNDNDGIRQVYQTPLTKTGILDFVSPATQLTALNTCLNSEEKDAGKQRLCVDRFESGSVEKTPIQKLSTLHDSEKNMSFHKKLFCDSSDVMHDSELRQSPEKPPSNKIFQFKLSKESNLSESQLLELCSGTFSTQPDNVKDLEKCNIQTKDEASQDVKLPLDEDSVTYVKTIFHEKEQIEENEGKQEISWSKSRVISSDEEDVIKAPNTIKKLKKRQVKKLVLSDDEENDATSSDEEEGIIEDEEKYVDYDSEENEISVPQKDLKKYAAGFLEDEAELSESDWDGSDDEDEKDLDKLELEEGDNEDIDQDQLRSQLGKIHMKQVLDEDQRDLRMIKELLFEDGDLHSDGPGRERKFKWRNIDKIDTDNTGSQNLENNDGWVDLSEDESELEWRKMRYEREKFLAEQKKTAQNEIEDNLNASPIFKLGMETFKKIKSNENRKRDSESDIGDPMEPKVPHVISEIMNGPSSGKKSRAIYNIMKKRSFLARGEASLARIAMMAKQNDTSSVNTRNFVFTHVSPRTESQPEPTVEAIPDQKNASQNKNRKRKDSLDLSQRSVKRMKTEENFTRRRNRF